MARRCCKVESPSPNQRHTFQVVILSHLLISLPFTLCFLGATLCDSCRRHSEVLIIEDCCRSTGAVCRTTFNGASREQYGLIVPLNRSSIATVMSLRGNRANRGSFRTAAKRSSFSMLFPMARSRKSKAKQMQLRICRVMREF